MHMNFIPNTSC